MYPITMKTKQIFKSVFPGKYIQGEGLLDEIPALLHTFGDKPLIISSPTAKKKVLTDVAENYQKRGIVMEEFKGECCEKELQRIEKIAIANANNVIAGIGGGKTIDTAKIIADRMEIPVLIFPTIASTDAPCSGCAVIYSEEGIFESVYYQKMNPQVVLMDVRIIADSPVRFLVSGMGDALATWFEARSCLRTKSMNACGGYSTIAGEAIAKQCYKTLLKYGTAAKMACENHIITPALHAIVEANTLLSGIGFESAGLATAHSIHNGLSLLEEVHSFYHGEKVAFGVLTGLHLTGARPEEMETVYGFCEAINLPTTFAALGITEVNREKLLKAATKACEPQEGIHHEAENITPEKVMFAMRAADAMGKNRKKAGKH